VRKIDHPLRRYYTMSAQSMANMRLNFAKRQAIRYMTLMTSGAPHTVEQSPCS
jgi:hypothetical protein